MRTMSADERAWLRNVGAVLTRIMEPHFHLSAWRPMRHCAVTGAYRMVWFSYRFGGRWTFTEEGQ